MTILVPTLTVMRTKTKNISSPLLRRVQPVFWQTFAAEAWIRLDTEVRLPREPFPLYMETCLPESTPRALWPGEVPIISQTRRLRTP